MIITSKDDNQLRLYGESQAQKHISIIATALEKAKATGNFKRWDDFIRNQEEMITWYLNIYINA